MSFRRLFSCRRPPIPMPISPLPSRRNLRCFKGENDTVATGEVGKNKRHEEECLTRRWQTTLAEEAPARAERRPCADSRWEFNRGYPSRREKRMNRPKFVTREGKPLKQLEFKIIQEPLNGLLRNMDSDLQRRMEQAGTLGNSDEHKQPMLLLIMLRFAINSYQAVGFLLSDLDSGFRKF